MTADTAVAVVVVVVDSRVVVAEVHIDMAPVLVVEEEEVVGEAVVSDWPYYYHLLSSTTAVVAATSTMVTKLEVVVIPVEQYCRWGEVATVIVASIQLWRWTVLQRLFSHPVRP